MKKTKMYKYTSTQGVIITPINLEIGNPSISYRLIADAKKILTDGNIRVGAAEATEEELELWQEVDKTEEELALDELIENENLEGDETNYKELLDIVTGAESE